MNEKEMNLAIYNKLADIAREVFKHVICEPGTYSVADVAKHIHTAETSERVRKVCADGVTREVYEPRIRRSFIKGFYWAEDYDPAKDTHAVEVEGFACKVNGWGVFLMLRKAATAWAIPTAARPVFTRKAETADPAAADSIAATFAVNKELRDLAAIVDPREKLRPVYALICIDTRRRAAVACNGFTLRVVALPDLQTAPGVADSYLIAPALLKSGKGRVTITADGYASNGATVAPLGEGRFPDWAGFVSSSLSIYNYSEAARVELSRPTFNALKKSVRAAAKLSERVTIAAQSYDTAATVYAHDIDHDHDHESRTELAAPARSSFNVVLRADQFAKLADVNAFYFVSNAAPVLAAASLGFYYFNPLLAENGEKYYNPFNVAPAGAMYDPLADFAEVAAPAAGSIESEAETAAAPAADSENDTAAAADSEADTLTAETIESEAETAAAPAADSENDTAAPAADLTADTNEPTPAETIESETAAAEVAAPAADLTAESEADTITAAERERLADTINSDNDPEHAAFAVGDVFELLTDTGTTVPARVRSLYFNNYDPTADPCWVYCYDCEPWINRHGQTIDGGSCDALRMKAAAPAADLTAESEADTITAAPAADLTADTNEPTPAEVAAPADLTAESEPTAAPVLTITPAPAADSEADTLPLLTIATADSQTADRAERRPLLLTVARYALRLAAAAALLLLLTIAPDRAADTLAAPAADNIEADTITAAELLTADSEAESRAEVAAPADSPRPAAERRHAPANKRESHARALLTIATADSIAAPLLTIEADTLTADTLTADALTAAAPAADSIESEGTDTPAEVATLEAAKKITDTPTDDTDSKADTITTDEPTDDTDPAAADSQTDSTPTDTAVNGHPHAHGSTPAAPAAPCSPSAPVAPIVIVCFGI